MSHKQEDQWVRVFEVTDPVRHTKGYTVYKVTSKVFPKNSIEADTQVVVWKRFSDFKKLHKALSLLHASLHLKGTFPKFSKDRIFGRFDKDVIEERRQSALNLLEFAAQHPPLFTSQIFVKFFQDGQVMSNDETTELKSSLPEPLHPLKTQSDTASILSESSDLSYTDSSCWSESAEHESNSYSFKRQESDDFSTSNEEDVTKSKPVRNGSTNNLAPLCDNDLVSFDPLLDGNSDTDSISVSSVTAGASNWWAAALEACVRLDTSPPSQQDQELQRIFDYPKPFADNSSNESSEVAKPSKFQFTSDVENHFAKSQLSDFDPLSSSSFEASVEEAKDAVKMKELPPLSPFPLEPTPNKSSTVGNYLLEAANLISQAQQSEVAGEFSAAFAFYKAAVGTLLEGVQEESDSAKREAVRRKTAQYLMRAEDIYSQFIKNKENLQKENNFYIPEMPLDGKAEALRGPLSELGRYRLLGIVGKVQLILDTQQKEIVVIKTLYKSPNPKPTNLPNIFPCNVPYLAKLLRIFETSYALFLVLQYASGGRLWDYVRSYLQRTSASQCADCILDKSMTNAEEINIQGKSNVYAGKMVNSTNKQVKSDVSAKITANQGLPIMKIDIDHNDELSQANIFEGSATSPHLLGSKCGTDCNAASSTHVSPAESAISVYSVANTVLEVPSPQSDNRDTLEVHSESIIQNMTEQNFAKAILSEANNSTNTCSHVDSTPPVHSGESLTVEQLIVNSRQLISKVDQTMNKIKGMNSEVCEGKISHSIESKSHSALGTPQAEKPRLSSSTSSLELSCSHSQRMHHVSQLFHHMDDVATQASTNPPHLPESSIKIWIAELVVALSHLHALGVVCQDLRPENILLGDKGHILLTYQYCCSCVDHTISKSAKDNLYTAPEVGGIYPVTPACDWWSVGALTFELLTGRSLSSCYPGGIVCLTSLSVPSHVSLQAHDLLSKLLQPNPSERLGYRGVEEIKAHSFFFDINWHNIENMTEVDHDNHF